MNDQCHRSSFPRRAYMALGLVAALLVGLLASFAGARPALATTNTPAKPASGGELNFVQSATSANTFGDFTLISQTYLNGNPNALLFVTGDWNPNNNYTGFDSKHVGVWYDSGAGEWGIFNEDGSAMTVGAQFNVLAWTSSVPSDGFYTQQAASNSSSYSMFINNSLSNGNPNARVFITANWNPGGVGGVYDNHAASVWYNPYAGMWEIYQDDISNIPPNAAFNVFIETSSYTVTVTENYGSYACINDSFILNGNPGATPIITHDWSGSYVTDVMGVWYDSAISEWCIFDDTGTMPANEQFFVDPV